MKFLVTVITVVALLAGAAALAQQSSPATSPRPAERTVPPQDSAGPDMAGPADAQVPARRPAAGEQAASALRDAAAGQEPQGTASIVRGADPGSIMAVAEAFGEARLLADDYGDPLVEAIVQGRPYDVTFYDCTANADCQSIMLRAAFRANGQTQGEIAAWNSNERFGKAYLDADGNPTVEMNLNLTGGVTVENLTDSFRRWETVLAAFAGHVGY